MVQPSVFIRAFAEDDGAVVSNLVRQVFDEHVAPGFEPEGIAEMYSFVTPEAIAERAQTQMTLLACVAHEIAGVIQMRQVDHIALLFVRSRHMGQGIATALMARAEENCHAAGYSTMTVNSSLNAQSFYERCGYLPTNEPQSLHGFVFIPMEKDLNLGDSTIQATKDRS